MDTVTIAIGLLLGACGGFSGALNTSLSGLRPATISGCVGLFFGTLMGAIGGAFFGGLSGFLMGSNEDSDRATVVGMLPGIMLGMLGPLPLPQGLTLLGILALIELIVFMVVRAHPRFLIKT